MESLQYVLHLFNSGELVMYPLLFLSLMVVAIAVERFMYFKNNGSRVNTLLHAVYELTKRKEWDTLEQVAKEENSMASRILLAGLHNDSAESTMKNAFAERVGMESVQFRKYMDYLRATVTISPILGLLGTVTGMIGSFSILDSGAGASAITGGVGEALIATASGL